MQEDPASYIEHVREAGYRWMETIPSGFPGVEEGSAVRPGDVTGGPQWFLTDGHPWGMSRLVRDYEPLNQFPTLFLTFAETRPTREGVLAFANKYGLLGGDVSVPIRLPIPQSGRAPLMVTLETEQGEQSYAMGTGEALDTWGREIQEMRQVVELCEMTGREDQEGLSRYIKWRAGGVYFTYTMQDANRWSGAQLSELSGQPDASGFGSHISDEQFRPHLLGRFERGDAVKPALAYMQRVVNLHLENRVSSRLLWGPHSHDPLGLYNVPHSLVGVLWLQFAKAVAGATAIRVCDCGNRFPISPRIGRKDKVFCSETCRVRAYRNRVAEARRLYSEGVLIEGIAERLGTKSQQINKWVEKGRGVQDEARSRQYPREK